ncbi:WD40 repeat domain-containing protein [Streptomyces sp. NPDC059153]|uniref:WD40 repeat domain-containing protein n=1 Tax=Streptomyces sp. NPDC059153 TaxID=3346743 RepID=UPI0036CFBA70
MNHGEMIFTVATAVVDGRPIAATGGRDRALRLWDLTTYEEIGHPFTHDATVVAATTMVIGERPHVITGSADQTVRLWNLASGEQIGPAWRFSAPINALDVAAGRLVVAFGQEIAALTPC